MTLSPGTTLGPYGARDSNLGRMVDNAIESDIWQLRLP